MRDWPLLLMGACFVAEIFLRRHLEQESSVSWVKSLARVILFGPIVSVVAIADHSMIAGAGASLIFGAWVYLLSRREKRGEAS